jgi:gliding motility-associated-like protein
VQLTAVNAHGCRDSVSRIVTPRDKPFSSFVAQPPAGCEPLQVRFINTSVGADPINQWAWSLGNGDSAFTKNVSATYPAGTYTVSLVATSVHGCRDTVVNPGMISSFPGPVAGFDYTPTQPSDFIPEVSFFDRSTDTDYWFWDFGDGVHATEPNPVHRYKPGHFIVTQVVMTANGCTDTLQRSLEYMYEYAYWFPNAFTPNGDGINDLFKGQGIGVRDFRLAVYNRFGHVVFETDNERKAWDGSYHNTPVPSGVYHYTADITDREQKSYQLQGRVTVVR